MCINAHEGKVTFQSNIKAIIHDVRLYHHCACRYAIQYTLLQEDE